MSEKHLHIISFDVPYPPNYGGVVDVYNRIGMLARKGVRIHLHCYDYGRGRQACLEDLCVEVNYYRRNSPLPSLLSKRPYIVQSRISEALKRNLLNDDYPILCEGLHTAFIVEDGCFTDRRVYVRMHNVEQDYYRMLAKSEPKWWKRFFFELEWRKIRAYEWILPKIDNVIAITQADADYFSRFVANVIVVPAFNSFERVLSKEGTGEYVLYHGNLSVVENARAAERLMGGVFPELGVKCVVAGLNPPQKLSAMADALPNVTLEANPSAERMRELIAGAQINVLVTDQPTGMKLKLLNALYLGRHCLVNADMLHGTGLESLCLVANSDSQLVEMVREYISKPFTADNIAQRAAVLDRLCSGSSGADRIIEFIKWE